MSSAVNSKRSRCAPTTLCAPQCLTVLYISRVRLRHKAFETVRRSICESNVQKEKVAAAAAPVEPALSLCLSASLWGRDYTLNPGMSRQRDEKDQFSLRDNADRREWRGFSWQEPTGFRRTKRGCQTHKGDIGFWGGRNIFMLLDITWRIVTNVMGLWRDLRDAVEEHRLSLWVLEEHTNILYHRIIYDTV